MQIDGYTAIAEFGGMKRSVQLDIIDFPPVVGDYVIVHAGFAIHRIDEVEANETISHIRELISSETEISS
jgi:hydrogenase expression/formation protein HypC